MNIQFSVNEYDYDGDVIEKGIYLHFDKTRIKVADTMEEFLEIPAQIAQIAEEIEHNGYLSKL